MDLPAGYRSRPVTLDDVDDASDLWRAADVSLGIPPRNPAEFLRWIWGTLPYVRRERDTVAVLAGDRLAAYATLVRDPAAIGSDVDWGGGVHPDHVGRGIGSALIGWAHAVASERAISEGACELRTSLPAENEAGHRLLERHGYRRVRSTFDMGADLAGDEPPGEPPPGVSLRRFETGRDERTFWEVEVDAFSEHWGMTPSPYESWVAEWYDDPDWDPSKVFLAESEGRAVGVCAWVANGAGGYLASIGVRKDRRGRGIGQALLRAAIADIAARGLRDVELSVDAENDTGAIGVYRKAGLQVRREHHVFQRGPT